MKRQTIVKPGYDCVRMPCGEGGCGRSPGSSHGIHNEVWIFAVSEGDAALTLSVGSGKYPETVPDETVAQLADDRPRGDDMSLHTAFPVESDDVREPGEGLVCEFVEGGRCWLGWRPSYSWAEEFFKIHGARAVEQPEAFWLAMEAELRERRAAIGPLPKRCEACGGKGLVSP